MSFFDGLSRPARGAGLALLGVALVAAVIGGVTLLAGGSDGDGTDLAGGSSTTKTSREGGSPTGDSTTEPSVTSPTSDTTRSTTSQEPTTSTTPGGDSGGDGTGDTDGDPARDGDSVRSVSVRVYNNSNIENLASRAASDLREQGWQVPGVDNYPWGIVRTTTAYYRPGTKEKPAAFALASEFGMRAEPRFDGIKDASPGLIVIVTKDYDGPADKSG